MKEVMKIVFATNNNHKLSEIRDILNEACEVKSLKEIGCDVDIPETGTTLEENALIKANYVWDHFHTNVFADDTGLEVEALNGEPGVYSARYAGGEGHDSEANIQKSAQEPRRNREPQGTLSHRYSIHSQKQSHWRKEVSLVEGIVNGSITTHKRGTAGFGYDAIFIPEGYDQTFGELGMDIKNEISHRARAVKNFAKELEDYIKE